MQKITLHQIVPNIFSTLPNLVSDIWHNDVTFEKGKTYLVEAGSGKGKSSLYSYIYGFRNDYTGAISFDETPISSLSKAQWCNVRKTQLSLMFQELRLFPGITAFENVQIKNQLTNHKSVKQIHEYFEMLGIADKLDSPVRLMSYGQQQRVALIRSICQPFDFVMLDEPVSHLDAMNTETLARILLDEAGAQGAGAIISSVGNHPNITYDKTYML